MQEGYHVFEREMGIGLKKVGMDDAGPLFTNSAWLQGLAEVFVVVRCGADRNEPAAVSFG